MPQIPMHYTKWTLMAYISFNDFSILFAKYLRKAYYIT